MTKTQPRTDALPGALLTGSAPHPPTHQLSLQCAVSRLVLHPRPGLLPQGQRLPCPGCCLPTPATRNRSFHSAATSLWTPRSRCGRYDSTTSQDKPFKLCAPKAHTEKHGGAFAPWKDGTSGSQLVDYREQGLACSTWSPPVMLTQTSSPRSPACSFSAGSQPSRCLGPPGQATCLPFKLVPPSVRTPTQEETEGPPGTASFSRASSRDGSGQQVFSSATAV